MSQTPVSWRKGGGGRIAVVEWMMEEEEEEEGKNEKEDRLPWCVYVCMYVS